MNTRSILLVALALVAVAFGMIFSLRTDTFQIAWLALLCGELAFWLPCNSSD
jgi:uncharacterized membrane protein YhfC